LSGIAYREAQDQPGARYADRIPSRDSLPQRLMSADGATKRRRVRLIALHMCLDV